MAIVQWECETINSLGWTETAWTRLSLVERSRKVCAHKLGDWLKTLEAEKQYREIKARYGK